MTTIRYSKARLKSNLTMAIGFSLIGVILVLLSDGMGEWKNISPNEIGIGQIFVGIFMFLVYRYEDKKQ